MPRPRKYDDRFKLLVHALKQTHPEWGHARITAELRNSMGGETPSDRTVSRFLQTLNSVEKVNAKLRIPWRAWDDYECDELRGATSYLMSVAGAVQSLEVFSIAGRSDHRLLTAALWDPVTDSDPREDPAAKVPELTLFEANWVVKIHTASPELSIHDTFWIAQDVLARERVHMLLEPESKFDYEDIHFLLAIKPWSSSRRYARYLRLVRSGNVPPYRFTPIADLGELQTPLPDSLLDPFSKDSKLRVSIAVPGDYSMISMFVERECRGMELVRRRALRNDFGFTRSWRNVTRALTSRKLSKPGV